MGIVSEAMWRLDALGYAVRRGGAAAARATGKRFRELGTLRGGSPSWRDEVASTVGRKDERMDQKCGMLVEDMMTCRRYIAVVQLMVAKPSTARSSSTVVRAQRQG